MPGSAIRSTFLQAWPQLVFSRCKRQLGRESTLPQARPQTGLASKVAWFRGGRDTIVVLYQLTMLASMKNILLPLALAVAASVAVAAPATVVELHQMVQRFAPVELKADASKLSPGDRRAIAKLIEAAKIIDVLQLRQRWAQNEALWAALKTDLTPLGRARLNAFWLNKGPWSGIDENRSFMPPEYAGIRIPAKKPEAANFYPAGATKQALESWIASLPAADKEQAQWFFTTIRTGADGKFKIVKYSG